MNRFYSANLFAVSFLLLSFLGVSDLAYSRITTTACLGGDPPEIFVDGGMIACPGETIRVALRVKNFVNITSMQFTLRWDPGQLEYQDLIDIPADFDNKTDTTMADQGYYNMNWLHPPLTGVTLGPEASLMTFVFRVTGGNGTVQLYFSETPTVLEISQNINGSPTLVNATATDDSVMIQAPAVTDINIDDQVGGEANGAIDITVSSGVGPYTFLWSNDATTEDINNLEAGDYYVTISDMRQCQSVAGPYTVQMLSSVSGLPSLTYLNVYPNPASDQIRVEAAFDQVENIRVRLSGLTGRRLFEQQHTGALLNTRVDVGALPRGIYLLELTGEEGTRVEKVVVQR